MRTCAASQQRRSGLWRCRIGDALQTVCGRRFLRPLATRPRRLEQPLVTTPAISMRAIVSFARLSEPRSVFCINSRHRSSSTGTALMCMIRSVSSRVVIGWDASRSSS